MGHLGISQEATIKALVGGTLIDGYGAEPIRNSVIVIEGDKIIAVGNQDNTMVPKNAEIISTEGMSVSTGLMGYARAYHAYGTFRLYVLG